MARTSNPVLNPRVLQGYGYGAARSGTMTVEGAINKTGLLLLILVVAAAFVWGQFFNGAYQSVQGLMMMGVIGGLVLGLITSFKADWSPLTAPLYAVCEGLALGGISAVFQVRYPGIPMEAVVATFSVLLIMLVAYRTGLVRPTEKFRMGVIAATGAVCLVYLVNFVMGFFGVQMHFLYDASPIGILVNVVVAALAALNLVLDFDFIERGAAEGAPAYFEWYAGFGLLVTLVWLYLELLRLLARLSGSRNSRDW